MGAGVLPVAKHNGTIYFLFGQEVYDKTWGDFGGSPHKPESVFDNAIREGYEELDGFLGPKTDLKEMVKSNLITILKSKDEKYHSHLFKMVYDPNLPFYFNNHHKFIKANFPEKVNKNGYFEKNKMKWFTIKELKKEKSNFRHFYKDIVQQIIDKF
jgi:hypothetical protein